MTSTALPLDGIRVIDFTQLIAGPTATMALGQLGAEVIKVERPSGDLARSIGGEIGTPPTFSALNGGKRSIAINLSTETGVFAARRVIGHADVVVQAFRPGVMKRLGLDYETLSKDNPRLIYVSLSAYNPSGVGGEWPGVDAVLQAATGVMAVTGDPDGPPTKTGFQVIDGASSLAIGQATLAALLQRERTGEGSNLELSLFEVATYIGTSAFATASHRQGELDRPGNTAGTLGAPTDMFAASDGYVMVAAYFPDQWIKFCTVLGATELTTDPRYFTNADRIINREELSHALAPIFLTRTRDEWATLLIEAGVISAPVLTQFEIVSDPKLRSLGNFRSVQDRHDDTFWIPDLPYSASSWKLKPVGPPPQLGEHTTEVLLQAGFAEEEVREMEAAGVLGPEVTAGW